MLTKSTPHSVSLLFSLWMKVTALVSRVGASSMQPSAVYGMIAPERPHTCGWHAGSPGKAWFDPTQYVREQRERRRLVAARLHQGLPTAERRACISPGARSAPSVRSGEFQHAAGVTGDGTWQGSIVNKANWCQSWWTVIKSGIICCILVCCGHLGIAWSGLKRLQA